MMKIVMTTGNTQTRFRRSHTKTKTGCDTCKRRRVKCDETRPFCMKCVGTGRTCQGYHPPKPWIFDPSVKSKAERSPSPGSVNTEESHSPPESDQQKFPLDPRLQNEPPPTPVTNICWGAAYREPLLSAFLQKFLSTKSTDSPNGTFTEWPKIACKLAGVPRHEFLTTALMSLAMCILSLEENDLRLRASAISIYQQSLPRLRRAISRLLQCQSDSLRKAVIAACLVCTHNEYIMEPNQCNAQQHLTGVTIIVAHGGFDCLEDEGVQRLFYDHRGLWLNASFESRQTPLHSQPGWQTISERTGLGLADGIYHSLYNIAAPVIELFAEFDAMDKKSITIPHLWDLISRVKELHAAFREWRQHSKLPVQRMLASAPETTEDERCAWVECLYESGLEITITLACFSAHLIHVDKLRLDIYEQLERKGVSTATHVEKTQASLRWHLAALRETIPAALAPHHGYEAMAYLPFLLSTLKHGAVISQQLQKYDEIHREFTNCLLSRTFLSSAESTPSIKEQPSPE